MSAEITKPAAGAASRPAAGAQRAAGAPTHGLGGTAAAVIGWLERNWLVLAAGLFAALPVIVATVHALADGWQPVADRGIIATRAYDVFSSHSPLVGQYSFAGIVTGRVTYSIGPMLYWLLALPARFGSPQMLALTMGIVNTAAIVGSVALARRRGGIWLMFATAVAIGLMSRSLSSEVFPDIWNPSAGLFPFTLLIFMCWSLACGDYRLLPLVVLVGSYVAQCELTYLSPALLLGLVAVVGLVLARVWSRPRARLGVSGVGAGANLDAIGRRRGRLRGWVVAAVLIGAACWTPAVIDQVAHHGNLGLVIRSALDRKEPLGFRVGERAVIRTVGIEPWWLRTPSNPFVRKIDVRHSPGGLATVTALLALLWLVAIVAVGLRRRRLDLAAGAATALALCAGLAAVASSTPSTPVLAATLGYTLWWASPAGMFIWLILGWSAVVVLGPPLLRWWRAGGLARAGGPAEVAGAGGSGRPAPAWLRAPAAVAGLGLCASLGAGIATATDWKPDWFRPDFKPIAQISSRLDSAVPSGRTVALLAQLDGVITPMRPSITFALRQHGVRPLGHGAFLRLGYWYELGHRHLDDVVWMYDSRRAPVRGAPVVARVFVASGTGRRRVDVSVSRPHGNPLG